MNELEALLASLAHPGFWHWFIAAIVLFVFELLLPTTFLLWLGIGAICTGIAVFISPPLPTSIQLVIFAVCSVISMLIGRKWIKKRPIETDEPLLNRRGDQYVGRVVTLSDPIINGIGHASIDDTRWKIEGPDTQAGEQVRVTALNGSSLLVQSVQGD